ncbi:hypothetical protein DFH09DRAFT_1087588 [Mycena vulgaris]|nr:hypothetical protein DFH09DRAFT_1087588 [Mycena vulgaris]
MPHPPQYSVGSTKGKPPGYGHNYYRTQSGCSTPISQGTHPPRQRQVPANGSHDYDYNGLNAPSRPQRPTSGQPFGIYTQPRSPTPAIHTHTAGWITRHLPLRTPHGQRMSAREAVEAITLAQAQAAIIPPITTDTSPTLACPHRTDRLGLVQRLSSMPYGNCLQQEISGRRGAELVEFYTPSVGMLTIYRLMPLYPHANVMSSFRRSTTYTINSGLAKNGPEVCFQSNLAEVNASPKMDELSTNTFGQYIAQIKSTCCTVLSYLLAINFFWL